MAIFYGNTKLTPSGIDKVYYGDSLVYQKQSGEIDYFYLESSYTNNIAFVKSGINWTTTPVYEYSFDKITWNTVSFTTEMTITQGQRLYIRGNNGRTAEGTNIYMRISTPQGTGNVTVGGDLVTLVNYSTMPTQLTSTYTFYKLFYNCTRLYDASKLYCSAIQFTTAAFREMFNGCTRLRTPMNKITTNNMAKLPSQFLNKMYMGCTSLFSPTKLNFINKPILSTNTMTSMYQGCTSLQYVSNIDFSYAESTSSMSLIYSGCTSLYISDTQTYPAMYEWKLPKNGVFGGTVTRTQTDAFLNCLGTRASDVLTITGGESVTYYTQEQPV